MTSERILEIALMNNTDKMKEVSKLKAFGCGDLTEAKIMCKNRFDSGHEFVELYNLLG